MSTMTLTAGQVESLHEIMTRCAQAAYDDGPCNFGGSEWNRSANSFEAGAALQEVAEILGIDGPDQHEDRIAEMETDHA